MKFAGGNLIYLSNDEYNKIKSLKEKKSDIDAPPIASTKIKSIKEKNETPQITNNDKLKDETNINIFTFQNESILKEIPLIPGVPKRCKKCMSILNNYSQLNNIENNKYEWKCEFCYSKNKIKIEKDFIPKSPIIEYCIEKPKENEIKTFNERSIIFCLDISGSMGETFKENISRLNIVKATIIKNIREINKNNPNYNIGLVTFESLIHYYGDGNNYIKIKDIDDIKILKQYGNEYKNILSKPIKECHENLISKISQLKEEGCTALGPAILFSLSLLMSKNNGGRIFLCTDGFANRGVGSFNNLRESIKFYKKIGEMAKVGEICINLITFSDSESNIQVLINMVQETGGEILQLNPKDNFDDVDTFLHNDIIASKVRLEVKLNKMLEFKNQNQRYLDNDSSCFTKFIGNIKKDMNLYFKFNFKSPSKIALIEDINIDNLIQIPFQTIIEYKDLNGNKNIRVYTEMKSICDDLEKILKDADFEIISAFAVQETAKLLLEGKYGDVLTTSITFDNFLRDTQDKNVSSRISSQIARQSLRTISMHSNYIMQNNNIASDFIMSSNYKFASQPMGIYKENAAPNINNRVDVFNQLNYNDFDLKKPILSPASYENKVNNIFNSNKKDEPKIVKQMKEKNQNLNDKDGNNNKKELQLNVQKSLDMLHSDLINKKHSNSQKNIGISSSQKNNKESIYNKLNKLFDKSIPKIKRSLSDRKKNKLEKI